MYTCSPLTGKAEAGSPWGKLADYTFKSISWVQQAILPCKSSPAWWGSQPLPSTCMITNRLSHVWAHVQRRTPTGAKFLWGFQLDVIWFSDWQCLHIKECRCEYQSTWDGTGTTQYNVPIKQHPHLQSYRFSREKQTSQDEKLGWHSAS